MLYIGMSAFTANSAAFVYHKSGALSTYITDDMVSLLLQSPSCQSTCFTPLTFLGPYQQIPKSSPIRLTTRTFGAFIPEVTNNPAHSTTALTLHVTPQLIMFVFIDFQEIPRPDDETTDEDR